ncbi:glycerol-3-phosphate responsive antiterminator [Caldicellulosiruptoraceae bacterium PP1]
MKNILIDILIQNPIIPAVRNNDSLNLAINSNCKFIFLLHSNILSINNEINLIKKHDKLCFVHIDLIEGLGKDDIGILYLKNIGVDGIISTKNNLISFAKEIGLLTIHRIFLLDSLSIESGIKITNNSQPDFIEVLPGVIPKAISLINNRIPIPIIAGGMINTKEEVINALKSGAIAISTSKLNLLDI